MANVATGQVGIYIDINAITVVQARYQAGKVEVVARGSAQTPAGAVEGANIEDPNRVAQALRALLREMKIVARTASVALPYQGYSFRSVRVPDVPHAERMPLVRNELEEAGALPLHSGTVDFLWISAPSTPGKRLIDAVTYYTNDAEVDHIREMMQQSGLQIARLEPGAVSMTRAYLASRSITEPVAVLSVFQKHSDLCIHDGNSVRTMRRIPSGWDDILPAARPSSPFYTYGDDLDDNGAEQEAGVPQPAFMASQWPNTPPGIPEETPAAAASLPVPAPSADAAFLASEVARSLAFFAREYPDAPRPQSVALLGPLRVTEALSPLLETTLPVPIQSGAPLAGLDMPRPILLDAEDSATSWLPALGVALGGVDTSIPALDLSQQEGRVKAGKRGPVVLLAGMAGSTLWMIAAAVASITLTVLESGAGNDDRRIVAETARIKAERAPLLKTAAVNGAAKALETKNKVPASEVLGRVADATPQGIAIKQIAVNSDGSVIIEGDALSPALEGQLAANLTLSKAIKSPYFESMGQDEKGALTFRMKGITRAPAPPPPASPAATKGIE